MSFHETRFPTAISRAAHGGPERRTDVVVLGSGAEERNARWANSRRAWNAGYGVKSLDDLHAVIAFFEERRGRLLRLPLARSRRLEILPAREHADRARPADRHRRRQHRRPSSSTKTLRLAPSSRGTATSGSPSPAQCSSPSPASPQTPGTALHRRHHHRPRHLPPRPHPRRRRTPSPPASSSTCPSASTPTSSRSTSTASATAPSPRSPSSRSDCSGSAHSRVCHPGQARAELMLSALRLFRARPGTQSQTRQLTQVALGPGSRCARPG